MKLVGVGVSFKVKKPGRRYRPKLVQGEDKYHDKGSVTDTQSEGGLIRLGEKHADYRNDLPKSGRQLVLEDFQVSFSLNLFLDGFSVGKDTELLKEVPKHLHPYDRASKSLFTAIENGWLPGDIFDDIPCKYVNGALLCEIRDYRNCLPQQAGTVGSPVIHRVLLRMCMENVIKDILSTADDSWSYEDLLEVESRILKALQPNLHLNPEPLFDRSHVEPVTRKLSLGISWAWKKRKLSDAPAQATKGGVGSSSCLSVLGYQDRILPCSRSVYEIQDNRMMLKTASQFDHLTVGSQFTDSCNRYIQKGNFPDSAIIPKENVTIRNPDIRKVSPLVPLRTARDEGQAIQGPVLKKPRQEPRNFSLHEFPGNQAQSTMQVTFRQSQLPGGQAENILAPDFQWKDFVLYQQTAADKNQNTRPYGKRCLLSLIKDGQKVISEGIPTMCARISSTATEEHVKRNNFPRADVARVKDNCSKMELRNNQYNLQLSPESKASIPSMNTISNSVVHPVGKNLRDEAVTQKGKALQNSEVSEFLGISSKNCHQKDYVPREASAKQQTNSLTKGLSMRNLDLPSGTCNISAIHARNSSLVNVCSPPTSEVSGDSLLQRFSKIEGLTQRHGLNNRKCKLDDLTSREAFIHYPLVAAELEDYQKVKLKDPVMERIPLSKCFMDVKLNDSKTRVLEYVRLSCIHHGRGMLTTNTEAQIKMLISEKSDDRIVKASLLYGQEHIDFPVLLTFPNTHIADLFATQFTSMIAREGYRLVSDRVELTPVLDSNVCSSSQPTLTVSSVTHSGGLLNQPSSAFSRRQSPSISVPVTGTMPAISVRQLPSQDALCGGQLVPNLNNQSPLSSMEGNLSKSALDAAVQLGLDQPHWQQIQNKCANLLSLLMRGERHRQQLMQKKSMEERLALGKGAPRTTKLVGGNQGLVNVAPSLLGNFLSMEGSKNSLGIGQIPRIGTLNPSDRLDGATTPDHSSTVLSSLRIAEGKGKGLMDVVSVKREAGLSPMAPSFPETAHLLNNQQPFQPLMQQKLQMRQQQQMRLALQTKATAGLTEYATFPQTEVSLQQIKQQTQLSHGSLSQLGNIGSLHGRP